MWNGGERELPRAPKLELARALVAIIAERFRETGANARMKSADLRAL